MAKEIKRSKVYWTLVGTVAVVSAVFIYIFYNQDTNLINTIGRTLDENAAPKFSQVVYGGFGDDAFNKPMDIAVINQLIYVTDTQNKRIQVFDLGGNPVLKFGKEGQNPGEFKFPYGITGDDKGQVYVADLYNGVISVHDSKGKFIKYFAEKKPSEKLIEAPGSIRLIQNKLYVTDIQKNKVLVFDLNGKKLLEVGKLGTKDGELRAPNAVTVDKEGNIYVVDTGNQRLQVFSSTGKFKKVINGTPDGKGASTFVNPRGIGIDSKGIIYVVSNLTHYIYGYDKDGKQLFVFGGSGEENDKFSLPNGLFIDSQDKIYITDTSNARFSIYN